MDVYTVYMYSEVTVLGMLYTCIEQHNSIWILGASLTRTIQVLGRTVRVSLPDCRLLWAAESYPRTCLHYMIALHYMLTALHACTTWCVHGSHSFTCMQLRSITLMHHMGMQYSSASIAFRRSSTPTMYARQYSNHAKRPASLAFFCKFW